MFTLLQKYDIECYKCNNHGHMAIYCKLMTPTRKTVAINSQDTKRKTYWREREEKESSMIALCATKKKNLWYLIVGVQKT